MNVYHVGDYVSFTVEGDLVHVVPKKLLNYEETVEYFRVLDKARAQVLANHRHFFMLGDGSIFQLVPEPRVRALAAQWTARNPIDGFCLYGIPPVMRTLLTLVFNAANLLRKNAAPFAWVKDEATGRKWIETRRTQLQLQESPVDRV